MDPVFEIIKYDNKCPIQEKGFHADLNRISE